MFCFVLFFCLCAMMASKKEALAHDGGETLFGITWERRGGGEGSENACFDLFLVSFSFVLLFLVALVDREGALVCLFFWFLVVGICWTLIGCPSLEPCL